MPLPSAVTSMPVLDTLTMLPPVPCAFITRIAAWHPNSTPLRLIPIPLPPPVTTAALPVRSNMLSSRAMVSPRSGGQVREPVAGCADRPTILRHADRFAPTRRPEAHRGAHHGDAAGGDGRPRRHAV